MMHGPVMTNTMSNEDDEDQRGMMMMMMIILFNDHGFRLNEGRYTEFISFISSSILYQILHEGCRQLPSHI